MPRATSITTGTTTGTSDNPMLKRPVNTMLFKMAGPISIGMLSTFLFQIVDTYFVGQLGANELAALAFSASIYLLLVSLFMGVSVGVSSVVARLYGAGLEGQARAYQRCFAICGFAICDAHPDCQPHDARHLCPIRRLW